MNLHRLDRLHFLEQALSLFGYGEGQCDPAYLRWHVGAAGAELSVDCGDVFDWGGSDREDLTPDNVHVLTRSLKECHALGHADAGATLFCARVGKLRPQGALYDLLDPSLWPLFDACGPPRQVGIGNPRKHPSERSPEETERIQKYRSGIEDWKKRMIEIERQAGEMGRSEEPALAGGAAEAGWRQPYSLLREKGQGAG